MISNDCDNTPLKIGDEVLIKDDSRDSWDSACVATVVGFDEEFIRVNCEQKNYRRFGKFPHNVRALVSIDLRVDEGL